MSSCTPSLRPTSMSMVAAKSLVPKSVTSAGTVWRLATKGRWSRADSCAERFGLIGRLARSCIFSWSISAWSFWFCSRTAP